MPYLVIEAGYFSAVIEFDPSRHIPIFDLLGAKSVSNTYSNPSFRFDKDSSTELSIKIVSSILPVLEDKKEKEMEDE